jgi:hypothetical protein
MKLVKSCYKILVQNYNFFIEKTIDIVKYLFNTTNLPYFYKIWMVCGDMDNFYVDYYYFLFRRIHQILYIKNKIDENYKKRRERFNLYIYV